MTPTPRSDLASVIPYSSPQPPARVRLNTNEAPWPPPDEVIEEIVDGLRRASLNRYPERDAARLYQMLAERVAVQADRLWIANGSNEVLLHIALAFGGSGRTALTFEPTYPLHSSIAAITGTVVATRPRTDFAVEPGAALKALDDVQPDVIFFCSPNNPSGNCERKQTVAAVADGSDALVVVDEAYGEFADPGASMLDLLDEHDNLAVIKTFSKAWTIAGIRLGYLVAGAGVVQDLRRVRLPYHLSTAAQVAGLAVLGHLDDAGAAVERTKEERERLFGALAAMGLQVYPSQANFLLFRSSEAGRIWEGLLENGILVRMFPQERGLEDCLRVTVGTPQENDDFLRALKDVIRG
jgi:histidinol-phosphate aminotransferase